ncbi:MAG: PAS domain-containing protein [Gammaproteobacteria bacterium]|nr:PAS domain-containing protein [Gammaproteobacteria bacterium]
MVHSRLPVGLLLLVASGAVRAQITTTDVSTHLPASSIILPTLVGVIVVLSYYIWRLRKKDHKTEDSTLFQQLAENIRETFWVLSPDFTQILYISPAYERIWGKTRESLIARPQSWLESIHPDDKASVSKALNDSQSGIAEVLEIPEFRILRPDGGVRWIMMRCYPVRDKQGNLQRITGLTEDITQRKLIAESLQSTNRVLETMGGSTRAIVRAESEQELLQQVCKNLVDAGGYQLAWVGFKREDVDRSVSINAYAGDSQQYLNKIQVGWGDNEQGQGPTGNAIRSGKTQINQASTKNVLFAPWRAKALQFQLSSSASLPLRIDGVVIGALNLYSSKLNAFSEKEILMLENLADDLSFGITSLRYRSALNETKRQLTATLEHITNLTETIPDILYQIDKDGKLISWNRKLQEITGYGPVELAQKNLIDILENDEENWAEQRLHAVFTSGESDDRFNIVNTDNEKLPFHFRSRIFHDADGNVVGATGIARYLGDELRAKREYEQVQHQLQQAQKMEAVGQLTGGIAHDFNNILTIIIGYIGLMQDEGNNIKPPMRSYLDEIYHAAYRARDLVSQLLTFSRTDTLERELLSIDPILKELTRMIRATIPSSIDIRVRTHDEGKLLNGNPVQLHQCITNLVINARDAIEEQGTINIETHIANNVQGVCNSCHESFEGNYISLTVADTGGGIPRSLSERIFDPFFTTKPLGKGTGMGLPMVHGIVHKHNGHIRLTSDGEGTQFEILLPYEENHSTKKIRLVHSKDEKVTSSGKNRHILLVDDELSITHFMQELLNLKGYQVTTFNSSLEALSYYESHTRDFDVVITDQTMPRLTGKQLIQRLLAINPGQKIILCSGYSEEIDESKALEVGAYCYLNKPIENEQLIKKLEELFAKSEASVLA